MTDAEKGQYRNEVRKGYRWHARGVEFDIVDDLGNVSIMEGWLRADKKASGNPGYPWP